MKITTIEPFRCKLGEGPLWDVREQALYGTDLLHRSIWRYDPATGAASGRRLFANTAALGGGPDGATVDAAGFLWSAICGGSKVVRYAPDGAVALVIDMPTPLISSVMFGGPDLDRLFVTSIDGAAAALDIEMAARNPVPHDEHSGAVFVIDGLGVTGLPEPRFAG